jgi:hypothetical protein
MIARRVGDWISAPVGEELVMMSVEHGKYLGLNGMGRRVWDLIERPRELADLCRTLEKEFEVTPEVCRTEIETFLDEMVRNGAVALDPA